MVETLPSGVVAQTMPGEARYVLPRGGPRWGAGCARLLGSLFILGMAAWIGLGIQTQLARSRPSLGSVLFALVLAGLVAIGGLRLAWVGFRRLAGRSVLEVRGGRVWSGRVWLGTRSGERSAEGGRLVSIDIARLGDGREEIVFSFAGSESISVGAGWPPLFLRRFLDELRQRHAPERPQPVVPRPPPSAPPPARPEPRPPGPAVRPAPPPVPRRATDTGIRFLSDSTPAASPAAALGECQVCSTPMTADLVACRKCHTPHHRSCWEYNRRCSTYGCGGTRSMPAGPSPAPPEPVVEIRGDGGGALKRRFLRDWMKQVAAEREWGAVQSHERKHRHCSVGFRVDRMVCDLVGRKHGDRFDFHVQAHLPTPEARSAAESYVLPARYSSIRRSVSEGRMELRPSSPLESLGQLRTFVAECCALLGEIASGDPVMPGGSGDGREEEIR